MSLQFIIDGYNITNHPKFIRQIPKNSPDSRVALIQLINFKKLCGSDNNRVIIIFDGFPDRAWNVSDSGNIDIVFSRKETADQKIKKIVEKFPLPKNLVVVSDDKEIIYFVKSFKAKAISVEGFVCPEKMLYLKRGKEPEPEISYTQMHKINEELRRLWLS